ncbi:MAG: transcriptional regulator, LacI family [Frankiales bacterium]|nr:transcriptional regulator, LacI family [Frankiales bacterium]
MSIKDVAARAGVSIGTVSNFLNKPELVAQSTQDRIREAIDQLGFIRNESARQLRAGTSRIIGLVLLDVRNPFFTDLARGAEQAAESAGLAVMLCSSDELAEKETRYLGLLQEQRVRGILITPVDGNDRQLAAIRDRGTPVVLVDRASSTGNECSVDVDDVLGGRLAVQHLAEGGHRRIAFVGGPQTLRQVADRWKGASEAAGSKVRLSLVPTPALTTEGGRQAAEKLVSLPASKRPTAVFCANDLLALGVLQELMRQRIRVPEDVALVGYDDIDFAAAAAVPLTSVRQPRAELGRAAAELLIAEAAGGPHTHQQLSFEPELVVRASSR